MREQLREDRTNPNPSIGVVLSFGSVNGHSFFWQIHVDPFQGENLGWTTKSAIASKSNNRFPVTIRCLINTAIYSFSRNEALPLIVGKLRNNMDAAEYKHVVLGLIFLKYISDSFDEHHAKLVGGQGDYAGANPEDKGEYLAANVFWVPVDARWPQLQSRAKLPSIGKDVDDAMVALERDNPRLKGALNKNYGRADYVLANPPFNDSDWFRKDDDVRWQFGVPPKVNANFAWVQHFVHHLAPQGMAGFVLANGSMSSNQSGEGEIRIAIVEADLVDCMVALPGQLFYSTQIPVCLWFLTKSKSAAKQRKRKGEMLFIDARKLGTLIDRVHRELTEVDLTKFVSTYHAWRGDVGVQALESVPLRIAVDLRKMAWRFLNFRTTSAIDFTPKKHQARIRISMSSGKKNRLP